LASMRTYGRGLARLSDFLLFRLTRAKIQVQILLKDAGANFAPIKASKRGEWLIALEHLRLVYTFKGLDGVYIYPTKVVAGIHPNLQQTKVMFVFKRGLGTFGVT